MSLVLEGVHVHCRLQGAPSGGKRRFGVPSGGAFDREAWLISNALAGNLQPETSLEIAFGGLRARAEGPLLLSLVGATLFLDGEPSLRTVVHVEAGQSVGVSAPHRARSYLSTYGGWRLLANGRLEASASSVYEPRVQSVATPSRKSELAVIPFEDGDRLEGSYRVDSRLDRVGIRLLDPLGVARPAGVSEPTVFGAIQRTLDGHLIVLGPDGPTVGGYPIQAVVCRADRDHLAQLRPGDEVRFESISVEEARERQLAWEASLLQRLTRLGVPSSPEIESAIKAL